MHDIYLLNYWTLYKEFINIFKELKFKQVPLTIISNFYTYIDQDLKKKMEDESFNKYFNDPVLNSQDIQNSFEELLIPLRTLMIPNKKGKILINSTHLRIRQDTIQKIFPENNAFLITNSPITNHLGLKINALKIINQTLKKSRLN
ncbi:hypothetical protein F6Y02_43460 [Bacillus megaterium]|nr:hypothetical protein [Priestia megaterium]